MPETTRTFRVYVSSTFSDFKEERNALKEKVFPRLRKLCNDWGCGFQVIDLRCGVSAEAGRDQKTMRICSEELRCCQDMSPRPNFIVLLGDRYGWRPLPEVIPATEFEPILELIPKGDDKDLLLSWYKRDDNAVPAEYFLKPRELDIPEGATTEERGELESKEEEEWKKIEAVLVPLLREAASKLDLAHEDRIKYIASATEQEIEAGAMQVEDADDHVFCFFRTIEGLPYDRKTNTYDTSAKDFVDMGEEGNPDPEAQAMLGDLKVRLAQQLPDDHIFEYQAQWIGVKQGTKEDPEGQEEQNRNTYPITTDHIDQLCVDIHDSLAGIIYMEMERMRCLLAREDDNLKAMEKAQEAFDEDRYKQAMEHARKVAKNTEYYKHARHLQSACYFHLGIQAVNDGEFEEAATNLKRALELNDDKQERSVIERQLKGLTDPGMGIIRKAHQAMEKENYREALTMASKIKRSSEFYDQAKHLQSAAYFYLAIEQIKNGKVQESLASFKKAYELNDDKKERRIIEKQLSVLMASDMGTAREVLQGKLMASGIGTAREAPQVMESEEYDKAPARLSEVKKPSRERPRPDRRITEIHKPITDKVQFTLSAPSAMIAGSSYVLYVWVHIEEQRREVITKAEEEHHRKKKELIMPSKSGIGKVSRGTVLTVHLIIPSFDVQDPFDTVEWEGKIGKATFPVRVPKDASPGQHLGTVKVDANGFEIVKLHFELMVGGQEAPVESIPTTEKRHLRAFASYASKDRKKVLARVQGIKKAVPDLEVFMDVLSLRSGVRWEEELVRAIKECDIFYLFWSKAARRSKWVEREWRKALDERGLDFIDPVPLVNPKKVTPPEELSSLHFYDSELLAIEATRGRRKY